MNKYEAVRTIIEATTTEPIVFTTGYACRIAGGIADRPNHFYMTGSMGLASSIGIGIAQETGRTTVVVDGDGSILMNPVGLLTAGAHRSLPLLHLTLDDGRYASTGGQAVPIRPDLGALATACGYLETHEVYSIADLAALLPDLLAGCSTPTFVRCVVWGTEPPMAARIDADLGSHAARFSTAVRALVRSGG